jgi:hypothetical protein
MMKKTLILAFILIFLLVIQLGAEDKLKVTPYGYVKLDAIYETGRASHGSFILWAADPGESDGLFHLTANETRVGLKIGGITVGNFDLSGKVEFDFYGGGSQNKATPMMRHAFMLLSNGLCSITAGQTWDIISPLIPSSLNYSVQWGGGNIGYRRPQLSLRRDFKSERSVFSLQAGAFRTITQDYDGDGIVDGMAAGYPMVQGRIAGKLLFGDGGHLQVGVSGHYGKSSGETDYTTDSVNLDVSIAFSKKFKLQGEYFTGKNLGQFLGGIVQEVNNGTEIRANGFWVNLVATVSKNISVSAGYSQDDPKDEDLSEGMRAKNNSVWANFVYKFSRHFLVGIEFSNWETEYLNQGKQKTFRIQNAWKLIF